MESKNQLKELVLAQREAAFLMMSYILSPSKNANEMTEAALLFAKISLLYAAVLQPSPGKYILEVGSVIMEFDSIAELIDVWRMQLAAGLECKVIPPTPASPYKGFFNLPGKGE